MNRWVFRRRALSLLFLLALTCSSRIAHSQDYCDGSPDPNCWCEEYGECDGDDCDPEVERTCVGGGGGGCGSGYVAYIVMSSDETMDDGGNVYVWVTVSNSDQSAGEAIVTATASLTMPDGTVIPEVTASTSDAASITASTSGTITSDTDNGGGNASYTGELDAVSGCGTVTAPPITDLLREALTNYAYTSFTPAGCVYTEECLVVPTCGAPTASPVPITFGSFPCPFFLYETQLVVNGKCFPIGHYTTGFNPKACT